VDELPTHSLESQPAPLADSAAPYADPPLPPGELPEVRALGVLLSGGAQPLSGLPAPASYEILEEVGRGGMGVVYKARQLGLNRIVALKMILAGAQVSPEHLARFRAEAEAAARLRHPNIVQVYEIGDWNGLPFFSLEYMDGGTLRDRLRQGPLPPDEATQLVESLAHAVQAAHDQGIIHRDLKPENILFQESATDQNRSTQKSDKNNLSSINAHARSLLAKITDFGLAKRLDAEIEQTRTGVVMGTASYMAPEQATGQTRDIGPAADLYSLGAVLYEALSGRPPFRAGDYLQTLEQVRSQEPISLSRLQSGLPRDLVTICSKCLQKEPRKRYASAAELAEDLRRFRAGEPILARPVPGWERVWKWARRHPAQAALAGVCVFTIVGALLGIVAHTIRLRREVERTEANYREARAVINQMLARLEERSAAEVPGLKELQRAQLEDALTFYDSILQKRETPDPALRRDLAQACERAARIEANLGRRASAEANFRRSLGIFEELAVANPRDTDAQADLADCCQYLGDFLTANPDPSQPETRSKEALATLERSLAIRERLATADPDNPRRAYDVARSYLSLGQLYQASAKPGPEAEKQFDQAFKYGQALLDDYPGRREYRLMMVSVNSRRAWIFLNTNRIPEADASYTAAEKLLQKLVEEKPEDLDTSIGLASLYGQRASFYHGTHRPEEAVAVATRAVEHLEEVVRKEPTYGPARAALVAAYGWRVYANNVLHRYAESAKDWDRIIALDDSLLRDFRRSERAVAFGRAGDHARAVAAAAELLAEGNQDGSTLYNVACAYALAAGAVRSDRILPQAECVARDEKYSTEAITLLQKLNKTGFFKDASVKESLRGDLEADLAAIKERGEFKELVRRVLDLK
jgi:serine/threonine protein kinase